MNLDKFSKSELEDLIGDKAALSQRLKELDTFIAAELESVVLQKMAAIVEDLNSRGHSLTPSKVQLDPSETDFCENHENRNIGLRVSSDIVISSGFNGIADCET